MFDQEQAKTNEDEARKLFSVPDFIGDMCKTLASRIRGAVAGVTFDEFHKNSARIIRGSVLGYDRATNKIKVTFFYLPKYLKSYSSRNWNSSRISFL